MIKTEYNCIMFALDNVEEREKRAGAGEVP